MEDADKALDLDVYNQLGNVLYKTTSYHLAVTMGFNKCLESLNFPLTTTPSRDKAVGSGGVSGVYNMRGLCYVATGDVEPAAAR